MNGRFALLACALSLLIAIPAFAQEGEEEAKKTEETEQVEEKKAEEAKKADEKKAEAAEEDEDEAEEKAEEAAGAKEAKAEEAKAEEAKPEAPKAAEAQPEEPLADEPGEAKAAEAAEKVDVPENPKKVEEAAASTGVSSGETASLGASAEVSAKSTKPWSVSGTLSQSLGQSIFVSDQQLDRAAYGYAVVLVGSYEIMDLLEGKLAATARWSFDQNLTVTRLDSFNRLWNPRDLALGVSGAGLYTEPTTGISFGAATSFTLPTSRQAIAADRVLTWTLNGSASKTFKELGPGNLTLSFSESFSAFAGPRKPTSSLAFCDSVSRHDSGTCYSSLRNPNVSFMHALAASYALGDLSFAFSFRIINTISHTLNGGDAPTRIDAGNLQDVLIGSSQFADPNTLPFGTTTWSTLSAAYSVTDALVVAGGLSTAQSPYFQSDNESKTLRFPFWDFITPANNFTSFFLDVSYSY
jgi:hypothetical protein